MVGLNVVRLPRTAVGEGRAQTLASMWVAYDLAAADEDLPAMLALTDAIVAVSARHPAPPGSSFSIAA